MAAKVAKRAPGGTIRRRRRLRACGGMRSTRIGPKRVRPAKAWPSVEACSRRKPTGDSAEGDDAYDAVKHPHTVDRARENSDGTAATGCCRSERTEPIFGAATSTGAAPTNDGEWPATYTYVRNESGCMTATLVMVVCWRKRWASSHRYRSGCKAGRWRSRRLSAELKTDGTDRNAVYADLPYDGLSTSLRR